MGNLIVEDNHYVDSKTWKSDTLIEIRNTPDGISSTIASEASEGKKDERRLARWIGCVSGLDLHA